MASPYHPIPVSDKSKRTVNQIRDIVDGLKITGNPALKIIPLSLGDPTVFHNLSPDPVVIGAIRSVLDNGAHHGYPPSIGYLDSRAAVAAKYTSDDHPLSAQDVVLCSGGSSAIDISLSSLLNPGDGVLIPSPGFPLYTTISTSYGFDCRYYNLLPERQWEIDLDHAETLMANGNVRVLILNNPSNPCGSVYSRSHLLDVLKFAARHRLCIVSDEIYAELVFSDDIQFHSLSSLSEDVPILTVAGMAKEFLVPGWRMGWILIHDRHDQLRDVRKALTATSQLILGPNSLVQAALPAIINQINQDYYTNLTDTLRNNAAVCVERLRQIPGLHCIPPRGAMYVMVQIVPNAFADIADDLEFSQKLLSEQSVFVLPGLPFRAPGFFRIVFCAPSDILNEAFDRITRFCEAHAAK